MTTQLLPLHLIPTANIKVLDHGYVKWLETWGSDEDIICAARMSTDKGFLGWDPGVCPACKGTKTNVDAPCTACKGEGTHKGDAKLLAYLWKNKHSTPFEFAGMTLEVQAPLMVFREWHRHRTQCLGPDTLVHFDAPKSRENRRFVYKVRIEDLWKKWQPTVRRDRPEHQVNALFPRSRVAAMQLRTASRPAACS